MIETKKILIETAEQLPRFKPGEMICVDVETTSFDDDQPAFSAFNGHRAAGYAICNMERTHAWYLPLRHHGNDVSDGDAKNFDLKQGQAWLQETMNHGRDIVNHNIKFDARFWYHDGVVVTGELLDTMVLARVVDNDRMSYALATLTGEKSDEVRNFIKALRPKTKDYGKCPILLMSRYAMNDVLITVGLYHDQLAKVPKCSTPIWDVERRLSKHLANAEIHGVNLNAERCRTKYRKQLSKAIELEEECHEMAGEIFSVGSEKDITRVMIGKFGIEPIAYTKKKNPEWQAKTLRLIDHPFAHRLADCRAEYHFTATFCQGWLDRVGEDGRLHTNFRQSGTRTGRMSCSDPNFMAVPAAAKWFIDPDDDCNVVSFDFSQIEYRLFAHYSGNEELIKAYADNPEQDYHQALADMLGVSRRFAKTLNFAFLYGMGKRKLLQSMIALAREEMNNPKVMIRLMSFLPDASLDGESLTDHPLTNTEFAQMANNIYDAYHRRVPSVRQLSRRVQDKICSHGWIRSYRGRVFCFPDVRWAYKGLNYLIQGSASDIFKERLLAVLEQLTYARLITNVYDDAVFSVPRARTAEFFGDCREILMDVHPIGKAPPLRVPLLVEGKVSRRSWGAAVVVDGDTTIEQALELSQQKQLDAA